MNVRMWQHAATVANMALLTARGIHVVGPDEGRWRATNTGPGRLANHRRSRRDPLLLSPTTARWPTRIGHQRTDARADRSGSLHRQSFERSSGTFDRGRARGTGAHVTLVSGPVSDARSRRRRGEARGKRATDAGRRARRRCQWISRCSPLQWRIGTSRGTSTGKIKKVRRRCHRRHWQLVPNPDILATIAQAGPTAPSAGHWVRCRNRRSDGQCAVQARTQERRLDCCQ